MPPDAEETGLRPRPPGRLQQLDARYGLLLALVYVIAVVATPIGQWRVLGGLGLVLALVAGISGVSVRSLLLRWSGFGILIAFLAALVAPGLPARTSHGLLTVVLSIVAKNSLALLMMLVLAAACSWPRLLRAMARLGVPRALVATLLFMERYIHVLGDELARMTQARRARTFATARAVRSWRPLTGMIGSLFLRSVDRAERVHLAMLARGWDGEFHHLD